MRRSPDSSLLFGAWHIERNVHALIRPKAYGRRLPRYLKEGRIEEIFHAMSYLAPTGMLVLVCRDCLWSRSAACM